MQKLFALSLVTLISGSAIAAEKSLECRMTVTASLNRQHQSQSISRRVEAIRASDETFNDRLPRTRMFDAVEFLDGTLAMNFKRNNQDATATVTVKSLDERGKEIKRARLKAKVNGNGRENDSVILPMPDGASVAAILEVDCDRDRMRAR